MSTFIDYTIRKMMVSVLDFTAFPNKSSVFHCALMFPVRTAQVSMLCVGRTQQTLGVWAHRQAGNLTLFPFCIDLLASAAEGAVLVSTKVHHSSETRPLFLLTSIALQGPVAILTCLFLGAKNTQEEYSTKRSNPPPRTYIKRAQNPRARGIGM